MTDAAMDVTMTTDSTQPMEIDHTTTNSSSALSERPPLPRVRSGQTTTPSGTPAKRGRPPSNTSTPNKRVPTPPKPRTQPIIRAPPLPDLSWSREDHEELLALVWKFGVQSVPNNSNAYHTIMAPSAISTSSSLASKPPKHVSEYLELFVWDLYASYAFIAPLLQPISPTYYLDTPFLEQLIQLHQIHNPTHEQFELASYTLTLPKDVSPSAPNSATEPYSILLSWISRLRHHFLLSEITTGDVHSSLISFLKYDSSARAVLPTEEWMAEDDEKLLSEAVANGYGSAASELMVERLDYVLDEFQLHCLQIPTTQSTSLAPNQVTPVSNPSTSTSAVPSLPLHSSRVWTTTLMNEVIQILETYGLPLLPYSNVLDTDKRIQSSLIQSSTFPFIDWSQTYGLLCRQNLKCDASWQTPLSHLLQHLSADYEAMIQSSITTTHPSFIQASLQPFGLDSNSSTPNLISPPVLLSFRRSLLFWHQLRVRILDISFHEFDHTNQLVEWVSQFAPGLLDPPKSSTAPTSSDELGSELSHSEARSIGNFLDGTASFHGHAVASSPMPAWWQIGFHDLCLLQLVNESGLELKSLLTTLNQSIANSKLTADEEVATAAATATATAENGSTSSSTTSTSTSTALHWHAVKIWLAHSRPIIRQRMGVSEMDGISGANEPLPTISAVTEDEFPAILKRLAQLVPALAAVATDELMNRLLQCVEVAPAPATAPTADGATEASPPSAPSYPQLFILTPPAASALQYFIRTLPGFSAQSELYGLLKTRYHELVPDSHKIRTHLIRPRRQQGGGANIVISNEDPPDNPLKSADQVFLRPNVFALSCTPPLAHFSAQSFTAIEGRPLTEKNPDIYFDVSEEDMADDEDGGNESQLMYLIDARKRNRTILQRLEQLFPQTKDDSSPPSLEQTISKVVMGEDGRLLLPQQLGDGFILHQLGTISSKHLHYSRPSPLAHHPHTTTAVKTEPIGSPKPPTPTAPVPSAATVPIILYPVGYVSIVIHQSYTQLDTLTSYLCEIMPHPQRDSDLLFRVTAADDLTHPLEGHSPQEVWDHIVTKILALEIDAPLIQRQGDVDGIERFGLMQPGVMHALVIELKSDQHLVHELNKLLTPSVVQAHLQSLPQVQFYLCEDGHSSSAERSTLQAALSATWSHHLLRYQSLSRGLIGEDTSVASRLRASAAAAQEEATRVAMQQAQQAAEAAAMQLQLQQQQHQQAAQQQAAAQAAAVAAQAAVHQAAAQHAAAQAAAASTLPYGADATAAATAQAQAQAASTYFPHYGMATQSAQTLHASPYATAYLDPTQQQQQAAYLQQFQYQHHHQAHPSTANSAYQQAALQHAHVLAQLQAAQHHQQQQQAQAQAQAAVAQATYLQTAANTKP